MIFVNVRVSRGRGRDSDSFRYRLLRFSMKRKFCLSLFSTGKYIIFVFLAADEVCSDVARSYLVKMG